MPEAAAARDVTRAGRSTAPTTAATIIVIIRIATGMGMAVAAGAAPAGPGGVISSACDRLSAPDFNVQAPYALERCCCLWWPGGRG